jgi:hypothetical protein
MARKSWSQLSPEYRTRLERAGITPAQHATGDLARARGHGATPEHPTDITGMSPEGRQRYRDYIQRRQTLVREVIAKKDRLWGGGLRYNSKRSRAAVESRMRDAGHVPTMAKLQAFMNMSDTEAQGFPFWRDPEWHFLFYH